jgi:hypothetical protein
MLIHLTATPAPVNRTRALTFTATCKHIAGLNAYGEIVPVRLTPEYVEYAYTVT